jgi:type IV secretory pathway TrbD component
VLAISAFTDWYSGAQADGLTLSVTGWHTGALGKLVFFIGLATLILEALREAGIDLPAAVPESLVLIGLGALATIFVLIRLISIPDTFFATASRGIGIFIALIAAILLIGAGLLRAAEEL